MAYVGKTNTSRNNICPVNNEACITLRTRLATSGQSIAVHLYGEATWSSAKLASIPSWENERRKTKSLAATNMQSPLLRHQAHLRLALFARGVLRCFFAAGVGAGQ